MPSEWSLVAIASLLRDTRDHERDILMSVLSTWLPQNNTAQHTSYSLRPLCLSGFLSIAYRCTEHGASPSQEMKGETSSANPVNPTFPLKGKVASSGCTQRHLYSLHLQHLAAMARGRPFNASKDCVERPASCQSDLRKRAKKLGFQNKCRTYHRGIV